MKKNKKAWVKPQIIVLQVKSQPENVLAACKSSASGPVSSYGGCHSGLMMDCTACQTFVGT
jgi:hypothetical protein